jgi:peptidyl-prolyl cis-trans isomerase SurA
VDRIVAQVNDDIITLSEVDDVGAPIYREIKRKYGENAQAEISQARREVLDQLVDQKLMEQVIKRYNITAGDTEVDLAIEDVKKQNGITQEALERALTREGISWEEYRDQVRKQIERTKLVNRQVHTRTKMDDADAKKYYEAHSEEFKQEEEILVRHILIPIGPGSTEEQKEAARKKAQEVLAKIRAGADFAQLAKQVSSGPTAAQGGSLGWLRRGETLPEFEAAAFVVDKGQTSDLVPTKIGFHIVRVEDKRPAHTLSFSEAREAIKRKITQDKMEADFSDWLKKLRENAYIEKKL